MTPSQFARLLRKRFRRRYGYINRLPEDTQARLEAVERRLGFGLPPVVRFIFEHAGEDFINPEWSAEHYGKWRNDPAWPERMVPLVEDGCGIWLCLDCSQKQAPVLKWRGDEATDESEELVFEHESPSFSRLASAADAPARRFLNSPLRSRARRQRPNQAASSLSEYERLVAWMPT